MHRFIKPCAVLLSLAVLLGGCATTDKVGSWATEKRDAVVARLNSAPVDEQSQARFDKAVATLRDGDAARAEAMFQSLADEFPTLAGPQLNLALIQMADGRLELAEASASTAQKLNPRSAPASNTLGIVLRRQGKFAQAEKAYRKAIDNDPNYAMAWRNLGVLYDLYLQRPHAALSAYRNFQALVTEPDREVALWISDLSLRHGEAPRTAAANP